VSSIVRLFAGILLLALSASPAAAQEAALGLRPVGFDRVRLDDGVWRERVASIGDRVLPALLERFEAEGHFTNFDVAAGAEGEHSGRRIADAECYRWLEAVATILHHQPGHRLRAPAVALIERIAAAQKRDGYLQTWYQVLQPRRRFRELEEGRELYSIGALIEAGLRWEQVTGETQLLDVARKAADLLVKRFGYEKIVDPPGFPGVEHALTRLAAHTGKRAYLDLALFLVEQRGSEERSKKLYGFYAQDHVPALGERAAEGHAVRALELYGGIAEIARRHGYEDYRVAALSIWNDVWRRKMYVTGGVGSQAYNRGFGDSYELPLETAYCETCAAAGFLRLSQSVFLYTAHAAGAEFVELELYNALLGAKSPDDRRFFHHNPMLSHGGVERVAVPEELCCPTELARTVPTIGGTIYAHTDDVLYVAQYVASTASIPLRYGEVGLVMETDYPRDGEVVLRFELERPLLFTLRVRIPGWCTDKVELGVGDVIQEVKVTHGDDPGTWLEFERVWKTGEIFTLRFPMNPARIEAASQVAATEGRTALRRGPELYCLEGADNGGPVFDRYLDRENRLWIEWEEELLGGVHVIHSSSRALRLGERGLGFEPVPLVAVPYRLWNNRGPGEMLVWIPETPDLCDVPGESGGLYQGNVAIHASHVDRHTTLRALNDGALPRSSSDHLPPRATFEDHRGTAEWVRYDFLEEQRFDHAAVYWFDEGEEGTCRVPASWKLEYLDGAEWREVTLIGGSYSTAVDRLNEVSFAPIRSVSLRLGIQLQPGYCGGILEWETGSTDPGASRRDR